MEIALRGIPASPGIAIGPAVTFRVRAIEAPRYKVEDWKSELARYDTAVGAARQTLTDLRDRIQEELGEQHAAIFKAHLEMLDDVALRPEIERRLEEEQVNVEYIVDQLIASYSKMLREVEDPQFRERSNDIVDVGRRILSALLNREMDSLEHLERPCVVVAHDLTPSETANMDISNTLGIAVDAGGPTSHSAILARAFEIPAVVGLRFLGAQVRSGDTLIIDGTQGRVIIRPNDETRKQYKEEKKRQDAQRRAFKETETKGPAVTLDGHEIETYANIELPAETELTQKDNCQGIGLYRTEYLFMNRIALPTEEEQYQAYKTVVEAMAPKPVTIRTLDIGGDKYIPYLRTPKEVNPQLGWRSIRFCLDRPDIFKAQLRALFRASQYGKVRIMFPMISSVDEMEETLAVVQQVRDDLTQRQVPFSSEVEVGAMVEVPSAVIMADRLAKICDFLSIGTNDLIQYALAVDRVNERTAHMYEPAHPAIVRMLKQTVSAAEKAGKRCFICGEMAGDPVYTELLLGLGFESLSMSPVALPKVRAVIGNVHMTKAKQFARKVLRAGTRAETRRLLLQRFEAHDALKLRPGMLAGADEEE